MAIKIKSALEQK